MTTIDNQMDNQIQIKVEEQVSKQICVGYDYKYERMVLKSCFVDGEEYFMVTDIIDFTARKNRSYGHITDKLRESGNNYVMNKWEMQKGGFFNSASVRTFTNRDGIKVIIETTILPHMERIEWLDKNVIGVHPEPPEFIKRELKYELMKIEELNFDGVYQRKVSVDKVRNIVRQFDIGVVGALIVSKREDGNYYVIDGQHRISAMKLLNIESIMCVIHEGLTIADEARLFKKCNNTRKQPSAIDNFRADLIAKNPITLEINKIVEENGFRINITNAKPSESAKPAITAVSALTKVYKEMGSEGLQYVLSVLKDTIYKPTHSDIAGMGIFVRKYEDKIDKNMLIKKLQKVTPVEILSKTRQMTEIMGGHLTTNYAKYILKVYNAGKQNTLEDLF